MKEVKKVCITYAYLISFLGFKWGDYIMLIILKLFQKEIEVNKNKRRKRFYGILCEVSRYVRFSNDRMDLDKTLNSELCLEVEQSSWWIQSLPNLNLQGK